MVPKGLRDAMGLEAGREIDIVFTDGKLEIEVAPMSAHLEVRDGITVIVPDADVPALSDEVIRQTLEAIRR